MKKQIFRFVMLLFACQNLIYAQHVLKDKSDVKWYMGIHQEKVFIHHNTSLLFTGEYLYYKLYCLNSRTNNLSNTSKVAYVELVGEQGEPLFIQKIKLENGLGQGEIFIPTSVPSGNYKLLGYTHWMRNGVENNFFNTDISIINPYQANQQRILTSNNSNQENFISDTKGLDVLNKNQSIKSNFSDEIALLTNTNTFNNRSIVSLVVKGLNKERSYGNYSISVKKIDTIITHSRHTSNSFSSHYKNNKIELRTIGDEIFLPEFSGEMIYGKVVHKETNLPAENKGVVISILGNIDKLDIANTNEYGVFYFHLKTFYNGANAILQVLGEDNDHYKIVMNKHQPLDYSNLEFDKFWITSKMKTLILDRSVYNQIQNGYFSVKPDTIKTAPIPEPFYGNHQDIYNLDDYTRFPTVKETMIEIIEHAWTKINKKGEQVFIVRGREFDPYFGSELLPLLIVDGVFIQNHEDVIEYETKNVKSISILRDEYYYGPQIYKGIVYIETIKGEYYNTLNKNYISNIELFKPRQKKNYFHQIYTEATKTETERIPDFRQQLLWMPELNLNKKEITINFFTSDNNGDYEICLEGFTNSGKPVSVKKIITVE